MSSPTLTDLEKTLKNTTNVLKYLSRTADRVAASSLRVHEFMALFAIEEGTQPELAKTLMAQDAASPSPYAVVTGLHNLRWYAFEPLERTGAQVMKKPTALILALVYDGDEDDILDGLMHGASASVVALLQFCRGFTQGTNPRDFLKQRHIPAGYLFRDLGTEDGPFSDPTYMGDASVAEIEDAARVQGEFEKFYVEHDFAKTDPKVLMQAFVQRFGALRTSLPLAPVERYVPAEARYVRKVVELNQRLQERIQQQFHLKKPLRGAHAKGHGLLQGWFEVHPLLPAKYRKGVFATEGAVHAWLRPSNGIHQRNPDSKDDARGVAIALDLDPSRDHRWALGGPSPTGRAEQNFILFSQPSFFAPDIRSFTTLMSIFQSGADSSKPLRILGFLAGSGSFTSFALFLKTLFFKVSHPLAATFHSATPYRLGNDADETETHVVKYSIEPADRSALERHAPPGRGDDFLREALRESLVSGPIVLNFYLYVHKNPRSHHIVDDVENTSLDWTGRVFDFRRGRFGGRITEKVLAATITIPEIDTARPHGLADRNGQPDPTSQAALDAAEARSFNPWNALYAHRPLGSLNRARWFIYRDGSKNRREGLAPPVSSVGTLPPANDTSKQAAE